MYGAIATTGTHSRWVKDSLAHALGMNAHSPATNREAKKIWDQLASVTGWVECARQSDQDKGMVLMQQIIPRSRPTGSDSTIQDVGINRDNAIWEVDTYGPVEETNWGFSMSSVRHAHNQIWSLSQTYRNAGSLPNKAMKTNAEIPKITHATVFRRPILL